MANPDPQRPWWQPTAPQPAVSAKGKNRQLNAIILSVIGLVALCCGGTAVVGVIAGPDKPKAADTTADDRRPLMVDPSISPSSAPTASSSPSPSRSSASPRPSRVPTAARSTPRRTATRKPAPKPKPTTKKPTPKPAPTTPVVQTGVRPGAFCSPAGAFGLTRSGRLMKCASSPRDERNRWRRA